MPSAGNIENGVLEYWSDGVLRKWNIGVMEY
jgi:hypothetical protein